MTTNTNTNTNTTANTTVNKNLNTRQSIGMIASAAAAIIGFIPVTVRAAGNAIEGVDQRWLNNSLKEDSFRDQLLGQSQLHDKVITITKQAVINSFNESKVKANQDEVMFDDVIVTPNQSNNQSNSTNQTTREEEVNTNPFTSRA